MKFLLQPGLEHKRIVISILIIAIYKNIPRILFVNAYSLYVICILSFLLCISLSVFLSLVNDISLTLPSLPLNSPSVDCLH